MTLAEPTTAITDWILAGLVIALAIRLRAVPRQRTVRYWQWAFIFTALGAFAAGVFHAVVGQTTAKVLTTLWKGSAFALGLAVFFMLLATAAGRLSTRSARILMIFAAVQLVVYTLWTARHDDFLSVISNYALGMAIVAAVNLVTYSRNPESARWIVAGIAVTALGSVVQALQIAPHRHFNHNDLFHVIQMAGMILLYRGARASQRHLPAGGMG